jgi:hypothetical protein
MFILLGLAVAVVGLLPFLLTGQLEGKRGRLRMKVALALGIFSTFFWSIIFYLSLPALVKPWWGLVGFAVGIMWILATLLDGLVGRRLPWRAALFPLGFILAWVGSAFWRGSEMINAAQYAALAGPVENRVWTQDVQPKDPRHIRMSSRENAIYLARQALGQAGSIGSQFQIDEHRTTLQKIGGQFWFIVPLDHVGWSTWRHVRAVPYYIKVSGEDPLLPAELIRLADGQQLLYTPHAYWSHNLERHLWTHGYASTGLTDYTPEVDEQGKIWWVVTTFDYAVNGWDGRKVTGILQIDPVNGEITPHKLGEISDWIDRVFPSEVLEDILNWKGRYSEGYWNTVGFLGIGAQRNLTEPETPNLVYGAEGQLQWVVGMTSINRRDTSLIGLYYVDSRTGKTVLYKAEGSIDEALIAAIGKHPDVQFKRLHGVSPQIYNILGSMASIIPLMNENHAFSGIGIVNVKNPQIMAFGTSQLEAYDNYQTAFFQSGKQIAPDLSRNSQKVEGMVDRFFAESLHGNLTFFLHLKGVPHLFSGNSQVSPKLRMTHEGDQVVLSFIASGQDIEPIQSFDNLSLPLESTKPQKEVRSQVTPGSPPDSNK